MPATQQLALFPEATFLPRADARLESLLARWEASHRPGAASTKNSSARKPERRPEQPSAEPLAPSKPTPHVQDQWLCGRRPEGGH